MYRIRLPVGMTSVVFAGHGVELLDNDTQNLRHTYTRAHEILAQTEAVLGGSLDELLDSEVWKTSSPMYQALKLGIDMAWLSALEDELGVPLHAIAAYVWGLSLGEPEALTAARVWELPVALGLLKRRGECIERHQPPKGEWDTHALVGVAREAVAGTISALRGGGFATLSITGHNDEKLALVAGHKQDLEELAAAFSKNGIKVKIIKVHLGGNIFHHPRSQASADEFEAEVRSSNPRTPKTKVLSNVTGFPHEDTAHLPHLLARHLVSPVEFFKSAQYLLAQGVKNVIIVGAPGPLKDLLRKRFERVWVVNSREALWTAKQELILSC